MARWPTNAVVTVLTILSLAWAPLSHAAGSCHMQEIGELPIQFDHGRMLVEAQIDGRPAKMIVDTGSTKTLIFYASAQAMGMAVRPLPGVKFYGAGGEAGAGQVRITDFRVANFVAHNDDLLVSGRLPVGPEQGLLGADFLLQDDVEFDVAGGKIRWFRANGCTGDAVVYWGKAYSSARMVGSGEEQRINVMVQVNGAPILAMMDSGAGSILTPTAAARAGVTPVSDGIARTGDIHGMGAHALDAYVGVFQSFGFGDETIRNAQLHIADLFAADKEVDLGSRIPEMAIQAPAMLLGIDFFRSHRIYVSRGQRTVYVSYVGGPVFQTR